MSELNVQVQSECCHYWVIDSPNGIDSKGRCKLCGEKRTFRNEFSPAPRKPKDVLEEAQVDGATLVSGYDDPAPDLN